MQLLNVSRGGTLCQHLPDERRRLDRASPDAPGRFATHAVRVERRQPPGARCSGSERARRQLLPPPGGGAARDRAARRRVVARRRRSRRSRRPMRSTSRSACSGTPSRWSTTRRTRRCSPRSCARRARPASSWPPRRAVAGDLSRVRDRRGAVASTAPPTSRWSTGWPMRWRRAARTARARGRTAASPWGIAGCAIIDLSERGAQPMVDSELGLAVVFNGCIYNHRELRARARGRAGCASSPTATPRWCSRPTASGATRCVDRFKGMFAFAHRRARQRAARARARPARRQAAVPRRRPGGGCASPRRCPALLRGRRRRHDASTAWRCTTT